MTVPGRQPRRAFARRRRRRGRHHAARARASRDALAARARACAPRAVARRGPRRLPRRRRRSPRNFLVDAGGRRRAARRHRRRRAASCSPRSCRAAVENWAALGAERALTGPIARGDEATVARQRAAIAERAPELLPLWDALAEATRAWRRRGARMRTHPHDRRDARAGSRGPRARAARSGSCRRWAPSTPAITRSCGRAREQCDAVVVSLFVNPAQFNDAARPRRLPAHRGSTTPPRPRELGVDVLFAPPVEEIYPRRLRHDGQVGRPRRGPRGRRARPGALRRRLHGRHQAVQHRRARRRLLRPEGRPAGRGRHAGWSRDLDIAVRIEVVPDRARAGRPRAVQPQRPPRRRATARARSGSRAALRAAREAVARRRARRRARPRGRAGRHARRASSPSTSRSSTPTRFEPLHHRRTAACSSPSPRASARPPDRQHPHRPEVATPLAGVNRKGALHVHPAPQPTDPQPARKPVTLTKLAEMRALGEPIVMVTAYDHPSALVVEAGRRRRRARRRLGRQQRARLRRHRARSRSTSC